MVDSQKMQSDKWFGAKTVYRWAPFRDPEGEPDIRYEERVTLIRAQDFDSAIEAAEAQAARYAESLGGAKYLGHVEVFEIYDALEDGAEVYSSTRSSDLESAEYLSRYYGAATK